MHSLIHVQDNNDLLKLVKDNGKLNVDGVLVCFGYTTHDCFAARDNAQ